MKRGNPFTAQLAGLGALLVASAGIALVAVFAAASMWLKGGAR
jgi:hypothetical protein